MSNKSQVKVMLNQLQTPRLLLRHWEDTDIEPFVALNQDIDVMEFFPNTLCREQSLEMIGRIESGFKTNGYGLFAAQLLETREFIGFVGLNVPRFECHFTPCVEIGWRLAKAYWGQGLATEAAQAVIDAGFEHYDLSEIVSFTTVHNLRSRRVMEKIGMTNNPAEDFDHPMVTGPLQRHVLYRKQKA